MTQQKSERGGPIRPRSHTPSRGSGSREKKTLFATEREGDAARLLRWHFARLGLENAVDRLVFFDESGLNLSTGRLYGRAPSHQRVLDDVPKNWGDSITLVAGMRASGLVAPMLVVGSMNGAAFADYVRCCVAPERRAGGIVVMDNLGAHKVDDARAAIEKVGAALLFLPPYSPDLNPIEMAWSKLKTFIRKLKPRHLDELVEATRRALESVTTSDLLGWLRHADYGQNQPMREML
jgi:transposase